MQLHRNAKLGLSGRFALVRAIEAGCSIREAARRHGVSPATACEWSRRWREASRAERESLACLHDRSSRPHRCPRMLPLAEQERICEKRRRTGWGPRLLAGELGHPHSTVSKTLQRNGCSRPEQRPRGPANRYEWPCPGDLLHMDSTSYARFERPGHRVTGDRSPGRWTSASDEEEHRGAAGQSARALLCNRRTEEAGGVIPTHRGRARSARRSRASRTSWSRPGPARCRR